MFFVVNAMENILNYCEYCLIINYCNINYYNRTRDISIFTFRGKKRIVNLLQETLIDLI